MLIVAKATNLHPSFAAIAYQLGCHPLNHSLNHHKTAQTPFAVGAGVAGVSPDSGVVALDGSKAHSVSALHGMQQTVPGVLEIWGGWKGG